MPVQMRVAGDEMLLSVEHRERDVAYPVLVDPEARVPITENSEGWSFSKVGGFTSVAPGSGEPLSISAPPTEIPFMDEGKYFEKAYGIWEYAPPSTPEFLRVEFVDATFSGTAENEKGEPDEGTYEELGACGRGYGWISNYSSSPPPESIVLEPEPKVKCSKFPIQVLLDLGSHGVDSGKVSVGAIVGYVTPTAEETETIESEEYGESNPGQPYRPKCYVGKPVDCATGNEVDTQTDLLVEGRGLGLSVTRTYNSQMAAKQTTHGPFGFGWSGPYSAHFGGAGECSHRFACAFPVYQNNGSAVAFEPSYGGGAFVAVNPLTQATLVYESGTYVFTSPNQTKLVFNSTGRLISETDRNGNTTTMKYNTEGQLESVSDPSGRKITFAYNPEGEVESVKDPMGHTVKYTYASGNLVSVTEPGESGLRWQFEYNGEHEMTSETNGRGNITTIEYTSRKVASETDPLGRTRKWSYSSSGKKKTTITEPNGSKTVEQFNSAGEVTSVTRASETSIAATTTYEYNSFNELIAVTDPNKHTTKYGYDSAGDRTSETDPDGDETKWTYDSTHDVATMTMPDGETTTIKRESHGNPEVIERPAPGGKTQKTTYKYDSYGDLTSETDPLERIRTFEYDSYGDRTAEIDPAGDKRTWGYNEDSQETSTISPRGNVSGGEPAPFTTTIERNAQGQPLTVTEPFSEGLYGFEFGSAGSENGELDIPVSLAVDGSGNVWVAEQENNRVQKFSSSGTFLAAYSSLGTGSTALKAPKGIAIDSKGDVWISDTGNHRIVELSSSGSLIQAFGYGVANGEAKAETCTSGCQVGISGSGNGQLEAPQSLAIDSKGNVWVAETGNDRVQEFNEKGEYVAKFGSEGTGADEFKGPTEIVTSGNDFYVADSGNNRMVELGSSGSFIQTFGFGVANGESKLETCTSSCQAGIAGTGTGQLDTPARIAMSPVDGDIYVANNGSSRVEVFTPSGTYLSQFGSAGKGGEGKFENLKGIVVGSSGSIYISEAGSEHIQEWTGAAPRVTQYKYDADGELETQTDPNGNTTKYTYDADDEPIKVEEPNGTKN